MDPQAGASYSVGSYSPSEASVLWQASKTPACGVLMAHGYTAGAIDYLTTYRTAPAQIARSFPVLTGDFGGPATWGNDAVIAAITGARNWKVAQPGVASGKSALYGGSMGCFSVLNWALANPTLVACIVLILPAVSLQDLHDNRQLSVPGDLAASIDTAYTDHAGYLAALASHDPNTTAHRAAFANIPIQIHYSTNDPLAVPSIALDFGAAVGADMRSLGPVGHSAMNQDYDVIRNFILAHAA